MSRPSSNRMTTLQQVADAAGVNIATASRVLAGKGREYRISEKTEILVRGIAERLNYQPNQVAQSLRTKRSGLLGVLVPDVANPFFAAIAKQVTVVAEEHGLSVLLADSHDVTGAEQKLVGQLLARQVEGLIICPVGVASEHLEDLASASCPVVLVDRVFDECGLVTVTSDHRAAAEEITRLLLKNGHKHIGVLQGLPGSLPNNERLAGFKAALRDAKIRFDSSKVEGHHFSETSGYDAAMSLLKKHPEITAFYAMSSQNALGGLRAATEVGRKIPEDLSIVAFDDLPFGQFLATPITTASQKVQVIGRTAAELVIQQIKSGKSPRRKRHRIPIEIVERSSIGAAKK